VCACNKRDERLWKQKQEGNSPSLAELSVQEVGMHPIVDIVELRLYQTTAVTLQVRNVCVLVANRSRQCSREVFSLMIVVIKKQSRCFATREGVRMRD